MKDISRRQFLKGSAAAAAATMLPWKVFAEKSAAKLDGAWQKGNTYRHAVRFPIHTEKLRKLEGRGISGDNALCGYEETNPVSYEFKSEEEIRGEIKKAKAILTQWAKERCLKYRIRPKKIQFVSKEFDWGSKLGIAITIKT